jgi:ribosome-associated protein
MRQRFRTTFASRLSEDGSLVVASDRFRHQARNLQDCFDKLREMVLKVLVPPKKRRPTRPTAASKERRIESKRRRSDTKKARKQDW